MFCWFFSAVLLLLFIPSAGLAQKLVLPVGHTQQMITAFFTPDDKRVVTSSQDNTTKIWDARTGYLLADLSGMHSKMDCAGEKIITINDSIINIWNLKTASLLKTFKAHSSMITSATFSADGKKIITSAIFDNQTKIWDVTTGKLLTILKASDNWLIDPVFNPDGNKVMGVLMDNIVEVWDVTRKQPLLSWKAHIDPVNAAVFSPDGKKIITASKDNSVKIWAVQTGKLLSEFDNPGWVTNVIINSAGDKLISLGEFRMQFIARTWNIVKDSLIADLSGHSNAVISATFSYDGQKIITTSFDKSAKIWDSNTGNLLSTLTGHKDWVNIAAFSHNGKKVLTASYDNTVRIWDVESGHTDITLKGSLHAQGSPVFNKRPQNLFLLSDRKEAKMINLNTGTLVSTKIPKTDSIKESKYSPDGKEILLLYTDNRIQLFDVETGKLLSDLKNVPDQLIDDIIFSPDGKKLVLKMHSDNENILVWDLETGDQLMIASGRLTGKDPYSVFTPDSKAIILSTGYASAEIINVTDVVTLAELKGDEDDIYLTAFSNTLNFVVTVPFEQNFFKVWNSTNGTLVKKIIAERSHLNFGVFNNNGDKLLTSGGENTIKIWEIPSGKLQKVLKGHTARILAVTFSPGGKKIATYSWDKTAKIWDLETGQLIADITSGNEFFRFVTFSPDEKNIVTISDGNMLNLWETQTGRLIYSFVLAENDNYFGQILSGYYQCSPAAAKLLHYVTKDLKVITFEQLDVKYNRPDKVLEAIGNTDTALINSYRKAWEKRIKKLGIDTTQFRDGYSVPECDFADRNKIEYEQKNGKLSLRIKGNDSTYKLDRFNVWVNESPLFGQRGISIKKKNSNSIDTTITIQLSQGENRIETSITNVNGTESYRMPLYVNYTPAVKQKEMTRFIGIGIDQFKDSQHNLQYSSKDIRDLAVKLKEKYKDDIIIDTLFNENVTAEKVKALKQKLQQTTVNDKVIISYSGHGLLSKDYDYYLSTYTVNFSKPEENGLPYDELESLLDSIPARKKLMFIDACHSGEVDKEEGVAMQKMADSLGLRKGIDLGNSTATTQHLGLKNSFELMQSLFVNVGKSTGATIISAAAGNQFALERGDLKNGVFTYSILEAMNKYPTMKISELKKIVGERVEQLTNGLQKPTSRNENIAVDWSLW